MIGFIFKSIYLNTQSKPSVLSDDWKDIEDLCFKIIVENTQNNIIKLF